MLLLNSKVNLVSVYRPSFFSTQAKNCSNTVIIGKDYQFPQKVSRHRERWSRVRHSIARKTHWCSCHLLPYHCERPFIAPEVGEPHPVNKILQAASCLGVRRGYRCHWHLHNRATEEKKVVADMPFGLNVWKVWKGGQDTAENKAVPGHVETHCCVKDDVFRCVYLPLHFRFSY